MFYSRVILLTVFFFGFGACLNASQNLMAQAASKDLKRLVSYMEGRFNNGTQAKKDTNYFDITLNMKRIWTKRKGEHWLYVEQAVTAAIERPYRQRVYKVYEKDGEFVSEVYTFENPMRFAGAHKKAKPLSELTPDSLELRDGCEVRLKKEGKGFKGSTGRQTCASERSGAKYATAEVTVQKKLLVSWDRGFDDKGDQVWGATEGGYYFVKQK